MRYTIPLFFVVTLVIATLSVYSQAERGGVPRSFNSEIQLKSGLPIIEVNTPDLFSIQKEDLEGARLEKSYRVGVEVPVSVSSANAGQWDNLPNGRLWRVTLVCKGAQALGLIYNELDLPADADIFVYTPDHKSVIGAITSSEINWKRYFTSRPIEGDKIQVEYFEPYSVKGQAEIKISGLVYMYRGFQPVEERSNKSMLSGACEVNVNCEEGQHWQNQKQGVVKILTKVGTKYFYCSGTVMNNSAQDFSGILLTASHCSDDFVGGTSTDDDFAQWVFYFNYESPGCLSAGAQEFTVVGAQKLAMSDNPSDFGSDFLLLKFLGDIPASYHPYYCGWDAGSGNSSSGVGIHHPNGEIKKISTYTSLLGSDTWGTTPNTHWTVTWTATQNGHGVTEGGSSGSPLFDDEGLLIGTLTGGESSCQNPGAEDMYGKFSYSWESNGTTADQQLKPWLDPGNTGIIKLPGSFNEELAVADFSANTEVIPVGGTINFQDLSAGKPDTWHWYFQRGKPSESTEQNPSGIRFESYGEMNVKLVVSNSHNSDSVVKEKYINVRAVVSPNPSTGEISVLTDINNSSDVNIEVFDACGQKAMQFNYSGSASASYQVKLPEYGNIFLVRVTQGDQVQVHKVLVVHYSNTGQ